MQSGGRDENHLDRILRLRRALHVRDRSSGRLDPRLRRALKSVRHELRCVTCTLALYTLSKPFAYHKILGIEEFPPYFFSSGSSF